MSTISDIESGNLDAPVYEDQKEDEKNYLDQGVDGIAKQVIACLDYYPGLPPIFP